MRLARGNQRPDRSSRCIGVERLGKLGPGRIQQLLDAKLRLLERALAISIKLDAALEGLERVVQAHFRLFHAGDELLEFIERLLELGMEMTPTVAGKIPTLVAMAAAELLSRVVDRQQPGSEKADPAISHSEQTTIRMENQRHAIP